MSQLRILVSHSHKDNAFCHALVAALREAGADVWYDESNLNPGVLRRIISNELSSRDVFIVVLSEAAMKSKWVKDECEWAYNLHQRGAIRIILPVLAGPIRESDFNGDWLPFEGLTRVGGFNPLTQQTAIERTLRHLALPVVHKVEIGDSLSAIDSVAVVEGRAGTESTPTSPVSQEAAPLDDARLARVLLERGEALSAQRQDAAALPYLQCATQLWPESSDAWIGLGRVHYGLAQFAEAINALERANPSPPSQAAYVRGLVGHAFNEMGQYDEALAAFNHAIALDADWAPLWVGKGMVLGNIGLGQNDASRLQECLDTLNRALELQLDTANMGMALLLKGKALRALGREDEATRLLAEGDRLMRTLSAQESQTTQDGDAHPSAATLSD